MIKIEIPVCIIMGCCLLLSAIGLAWTIETFWGLFNVYGWATAFFYSLDNYFNN